MNSDEASLQVCGIFFPQGKVVLLCPELITIVTVFSLD